MGAPSALSLAPIATASTTAASTAPSTGFTFSAPSQPSSGGVGGFVFGGASSSSFGASLRFSQSPLITALDLSKGPALPEKLFSAALLKSPSEYVRELELDADDEDDIATELQQAVDAWRAVVGGDGAETVDMSVEAAVQEDDGGVICRLMTRLGTTYDAESHGSELRRIAASNADKADHLCVADFADWFVRWLHAPDFSLDNAERESEGSREKNDFFDENDDPFWDLDRGSDESRGKNDFFDENDVRTSEQLWVHIFYDIRGCIIFTSL